MYGPVHKLSRQNVGFFANSFALAVRAANDSDDLRRAIVLAVRRVDPDVPISMPRTMAEQLRQILAARRFVAMILAVFAGAALVLAVSGVYTVLSADAREHRREFAIRLALGASGRRIVTGVVTQAGRLLLAGIPLGFIMTVAALPLLAAAMGIRSTEWWAWVLAPMLLFVVAIAASYLRARQVLDLDPSVALRVE